MTNSPRFRPLRRRAWRCRPSLLATLVLAASVLAVVGSAGAQTGLEIMRKQNELHRAKDEQTAVRMLLYSKSGDRKERRIVNYVLNGPDELAKTLLRFIEPRDVENTGLLTWERKDGNDDQWLYLPSVGKVKRIASSGKKNRFMGSDFAYEDLRPENLSIHTYTVVAGEQLDGHECWVIEAVPVTERQAADSGYGKRRIWVRKDIYLTVKQEYYDKKGRVEKIGAGRQFVNVRGSMWRPGEVEMRDAQAGTRTVMVTEKRSLDSGLKDGFFSEAELVRGRP